MSPLRLLPPQSGTAGPEAHQRGAAPRRWWRAAGRHPSWPYLTAAGMLLAALLGLAWPRNPVVWTAFSQLMPHRDPQVVLVDIDAASAADYGPLNTWDAGLYRAALTRLQDAGVRATGLDVLIDPARPGAAEIGDVLDQAQVVRAAEPSQLLQFARQTGTPAAQANASLYGLSAVNPNLIGPPYTFQAEYRLADGQLVPSLAAQLARAAGVRVPMNTSARLLHSFQPSVLETRLSFRDVVRGQFSYGDIQNKVVLIGQASPDPLRPTGSELQARAAASLMAPPFTEFPAWTVALLAALVTGLSAVLGRYWGLLFAVLLPPLAVLLWLLQVALPVITLVLAALLGLALGGLEYLLARTGRDRAASLSGQLLGTRAGLSQAVEMLSRAPRPAEALDAPGQPVLFFIRLEGFRELEGQFGRVWAEEALDQGLRILKQHGTQWPHVETFGFRWADDELAFIADPIANDAEARAALHSFTSALSSVSLRGEQLQAWGAYAWIRSPAPGTPPQEVTAADLIAAARAHLRPAPLYTADPAEKA